MFRLQLLLFALSSFTFSSLFGFSSTWACLWPSLGASRAPNWPANCTIQSQYTLTICTICATCSPLSHSKHTQCWILLILVLLLLLFLAISRQDCSPSGWPRQSETLAGCLLSADSLLAACWLPALFVGQSASVWGKVGLNAGKLEVNLKLSGLQANGK